MSFRYFIPVLLFASLHISVNAYAKTFRFDCNDDKKNSLQFDLDSKYINVNSKTTETMDLQFVFNGETHVWKGAEFLSLAVGDGQYGTFFKNSSLDIIYLEVTDNKPMVEMNLKLQGYDLVCTQTSL